MVDFEKSDSSEPRYYIALVLRGSERQYLSLLKYINCRNGSKVIYQCKSLTYLHVSRVDPVKIEAAPEETALKITCARKKHLEEMETFV